MNLDADTVRSCKDLASSIALSTLNQIDSYTTTSIERSILRLFGMNGPCTYDPGKPMVNHVLDNSLIDLERGALYSIAATMTLHQCEISTAIEKIASGEYLPGTVPDPLAVFRLQTVAKGLMDKAAQSKKVKTEPTEKPLIYLIIATGNIDDDADQAYAAASAGADIIAVIRSTAQSLIDYVPVGKTFEGFGGTYATPENFAHVRKSLDLAEKETGFRKYLTNYASGLCMSEIAVEGALNGIDMLLNDSMYGILFRDINPFRTFIDQHFSRKICTAAGIIINTGEDNYLTTSDAIEKAYTVTASQFINRAFAHLSGMPDSLIGLGHAYEIDPYIKNSMSYEISHALLTRTLFPDCPIKFMPPTKHKQQDIFFSHAHDTMYNLISKLTRQDIHLVGILTEAIHTPFIFDRLKSLEATQYVFNAASGVIGNFELKEGSFIESRANAVLLEAQGLLQEIASKGIFPILANGEFAGIKRPIDAGKGRTGVFQKHCDYIELSV